MSEVVADSWRRYLLQLQLHPLRTKAITAGVLAGCSDLIAQKIAGIKTLQLRRLLLIMLYGFAYGGPFGHFLHKLMDIIFKGKKGNKTVAQKVLLEQLTTSPWNNMFFMMYYRKTMEFSQEQGQKGLPNSPIDCMEVLADSWLGELPIYASAIPCFVPQFRCFMLGNISESQGTFHFCEEGLVL